MSPTPPGRRRTRGDRVPVVALTGHLGAGKTTVLNHLLRQPGARVGVVVNDFGDINVDAGLVSGQIGDPVSIPGGCLCCLDDADDFDDALARLSQPRLGLDVVVVEASGVAEPSALARLIRFSGAERVRPGGVVEVVDAVEYFSTIDTGGVPPLRFEAASLVLVNKCDRLPVAERQATIARIRARVRAHNRHAPVVAISAGRVDPRLVYDVATAEEPADQLPIAALLRDHGAGDHDHADAVSVATAAPVDPGRVIDLLEEPPPGAYRIKGRIPVATARGLRHYVVHLVGRSIHVSSTTAASSTTPPAGELVAIGFGLDPDATRALLTTALEPADRAPAVGFRRLQRYRRLSL